MSAAEIMQNSALYLTSLGAVITVISIVAVADDLIGFIVRIFEGRRNAV